MKNYIKGFNNLRINLLIEIVLYAVLFCSYSFGETKDPFEFSNFLFFIVYVIATIVINYAFLPAFFYKKKYLLFLISVLVVGTAAILVEEFVLEQIFYPDTRGRHFFGFFHSWAEIMPYILIPVGFKALLDLGKKQYQIEQLQKLVQESELQFLKNQINPHFLFNNLNNLYSFAVENSKQVPEIILQLSNVLRYMLYDCREDYVMLNKEIKHIKDLVSLYELQIQERGNVEINISCKENNLNIAPLMLNVFVENAFKHSTSSISNGLYISVDIKQEGQLLYFKCVNNFTSQSNTNSLGHGIGLENVKNRLDLLYPNEHSLSLKKNEDQFIVELNISLADD
mgnify:CR=1 FL=1